MVKPFAWVSMDCYLIFTDFMIRSLKFSLERIFMALESTNVILKERTGPDKDAFFSRQVVLWKSNAGGVQPLSFGPGSTPQFYRRGCKEDRSVKQKVVE